MARDGNGRYILPQNSFYPAIKGNAATPDDFNALVEDIAGALTQSFAADGQTPVQNNLNMNGYRMTNVGAPLGANDAIGRGFLAKGNSVTRTTILTLPTQGSMFDVTGTGTIEGIAASFTGRQAWLRFDSDVTLVDSPTFKMVGGKDWSAQAGDTGLFIETANGEWTCVIRNPMGTASQYDVGTFDGQIPTNGDLGSAAYIDVGAGDEEIPKNKDFGTAARANIGTEPNEVPQNKDFDNGAKTHITISGGNPSGGKSGDIWFKI